VFTPTASRPSLFLTLSHQRVSWGCRLGEDTGGIPDPTDQRDIPKHTASWSAIKAGEKGGKGHTHTLRVMAFVFPRNR